MNRYNGTYTGDRLKHIAFPLGGIGAGMFCIQGSGMLGNFSIRNSPDVHNEPNMFSAIYVKTKTGSIAKVLEGQVPYLKIFRGTGVGHSGSGNGLEGKNYGLPRFRDNDFSARFPFANINLYDDKVPLDISIKGWSPFIPLNANDSSLPVAAIEYSFINNSDDEVEAVFSYNSLNFLDVKKHGTGPPTDRDACVYRSDNGFILYQRPAEVSSGASTWFYVSADEEASVNTNWYNGGWFDKLTMVWNDIKSGAMKDSHQDENKSPGGSLSVPFKLKPGERKNITLRFVWYSPNSSVRKGRELECSSECDCNREGYIPWYTGVFNSVEEVMSYFSSNFNKLREKSLLFSETFFSSNLPDEILEAVSANLCILKSPTILRQTDGRLWCWEGCCDDAGCCYGSCTHVWNYAQSLCHLFPELERSLRKTEFNECQNEEGHQTFRASLPIRPAGHDFHAASDGQLGGIMKVYREWRISGDTNWMASYWGKSKSSMDYCIRTWDKKLEGVLKEPHHNTYDIEFWGADGMCSSFYLGALKATYLMGKELGKNVDDYISLYEKGKKYIEEKLFNGEYFFQATEWQILETKLNPDGENEQCRKLIEKEGPKYQYGTGCISDGVLGAWIARLCGLGDILDPEKVKSHLLSVYKNNFRKSLVDHVNTQRPGYALGVEGGLLLCTWPKGGKPSLPFPYSDEVWTGIEYQVASHLMLLGEVNKALEIVQVARERHNGLKRNPFDEYECGHWYARAMSSYALLEGYTGIRYDSVDKVLYIKKDFSEGMKSFLCTESGYGIVYFDNKGIEIDEIEGHIEISKIIAK